MLRPDYGWYSEEWGGSAPEALFRANVGQAEGVVMQLVGFNEVSPAQEDAYRRAVCAGVDALATYGADFGSMTVGSFSVSAGAKTGRQIAMEDARAQLVRSGLLWGGAA